MMKYSTKRNLTSLLGAAMVAAPIATAYASGEDESLLVNNRENGDLYCPDGSKVKINDTLWNTAANILYGHAVDCKSPIDEQRGTARFIYFATQGRLADVKYELTQEDISEETRNSLLEEKTELEHDVVIAQECVIVAGKDGLPDIDGYLCLNQSAIEYIRKLNPDYGRNTEEGSTDNGKFPENSNNGVKPVTEPENGCPECPEYEFGDGVDLDDLVEVLILNPEFNTYIENKIDDSVDFERDIRDNVDKRKIIRTLIDMDVINRDIANHQWGKEYIDNLYEHRTIEAEDGTKVRIETGALGTRLDEVSNFYGPNFDLDLRIAKDDFTLELSPEVQVLFGQMNQQYVNAQGLVYILSGKDSENTIQGGLMINGGVRAWNRGRTSISPFFTAGPAVGFEHKAGRSKLEGRLGAGFGVANENDFFMRLPAMFSYETELVNSKVKLDAESRTGIIIPKNGEAIVDSNLEIGASFLGDVDNAFVGARIYTILSQTPGIGLQLVVQPKPKDKTEGDEE
ncbi:MAG: hypothetical protein ABIJ18_04420 [archaeon]